MQKFCKPVLLTTLLLTSMTSFSDTASPILPRVSVTGLSGDETTGTLDAMVPFLGNIHNLVYGDLQGKIGNDHAWMGSLGTGYRQVVNPSDILGAYIFMDRNVSADKNTFWVLSPGVESLGYLWDVRANGYFPVSSKQVFDHSAWGDQLGLSQDVTFTGHQQFDRLFNLYEEVGPGADGEIGRIFPCLNRLAIYGGGYFFSLHDASNIRGVEARIEYPINRYFTAMVKDTYDNQQHNTIMAGVRVSIGKPKICPGSFDIQQRMLDPIERGLGTLNTGSNIPSVKVRDNGRFLLQRDNIWFFTQNGAAVGSPEVMGCGMYEHPCFGSQFTQATVDAINAQAPNANFYFNTGNYPLSGNGRIALNNGQSIYGRMPDYKMAAQGNARPVFTGGFDLDQGNNTLESFQLFNNNGAQVTAIDINNSNNILLNNLLVGASNTQQGYGTALTLSNAQNIDLTHSTVNAFAQNSTTGANATGIQAADSSLTVNGSTIVAKALTLGKYSNIISAQAIGINGFSSSTIKIDYSNIAATSNIFGTGQILFSDSEGVLIANSILTMNHSVVNVHSAVFGVTTPNGEITVDGEGVQGIGHSTNMMVQNSTINAISTAIGKTEGAVAIDNMGILAFGGARLSMVNSQVAAKSVAIAQAGQQIVTETDGVLADGGTININHCTINAKDSILGSSPKLSNFTHGVFVRNNALANVNNSLITADAITLGDGTVNTQLTSADGILAFNGRVNVANSFIASGAFANFGDAISAGIETAGSIINAQNNTFLVLAAAPNGGAHALGILNDGGSTITDINNTYYIFSNTKSLTKKQNHDILLHG